MLDCLEERAGELSRHLTELTDQLTRTTDEAARREVKQARRDARGRLSVYTPALAAITTTDEAREYLERVSAEALRLLCDIKQPGETISETEAAAPAISGFYHETRYSLALLDCTGEGKAKG